MTFSSSIIASISLIGFWDMGPLITVKKLFCNIDALIMCNITCTIVCIDNKLFASKTCTNMKPEIFVEELMLEDDVLRCALTSVHSLISGRN